MMKLRPVARRIILSVAYSSPMKTGKPAFSDATVVDDSPTPLFLWLGSASDVATSDKSDESDEHQHRTAFKKLLLPVAYVSDDPTANIVSTSDEVLERVNQHYEKSHNFVGGMGESDPGVWFATTPHSSQDGLDFLPLIQKSIALVKQERHGVPFGLYTTGISSSSSLVVPLTELGLGTLQVSLFAGSPLDYAAATGLSDKGAFGKVCGFVADAAEQGIAVEVGVLKKYATTGARDLAHSLGARHVHVYDE
jgi:hypothetical protein